MRISKYLHSCLLIEDSGKKLLIDPGSFSFVEGKLKPEDIGAVDAMLFTHKHPDHYFPEAIKKIMVLKPTTLVTHQEIGTMLETEGLSYERITAGSTQDVAGFTIQGLEAPHGPIPSVLPDNLAFLVNGKLLHPGDSITVNGLDHCEVLALPIAAPWLRLVDALEFAKKLKPRIVIPIHDAIVKDFMLERMNQMCTTILAEAGIEFKALGIGEGIEV